jgi:hypothetical protein
VDIKEKIYNMKLPIKTRKQRSITIRLDHVEYNHLLLMQQLLGCSMSSLVREALHNHLNSSLDRTTAPA